MTAIKNIVICFLPSSYPGVIAALRVHNRVQPDCNGEIAMKNERRAGVTVIIIITMYVLMTMPVIVHHCLRLVVRFCTQYFVRSFVHSFRFVSFRFVSFVRQKKNLGHF